MKRFGLLLKKWVQGCSALMALYIVISPGGIAIRLFALGVAVGCLERWTKSRRELDAFVPAGVPVTRQAIEAVFRSEPRASFMKMPARYPRPVYIHRVTFR